MKRDKNLFENQSPYGEDALGITTRLNRTGIAPRQASIKERIYLKG